MSRIVSSYHVVRIDTINDKTAHTSYIDLAKTEDISI